MSKRNEIVMNWGILEESACELFKRATVCYFAIIVNMNQS